jgi:hypothetical protein
LVKDELRSHRTRRIVRGLEIDGEDIETRRSLAGGRGQPVKVRAGKSLKGSLLVLIDGKLGWESVAVTAGLDLDEAKRGTIPADEIDVATKFCRLPAASDDGVSRASEKKERLAFA